MRDKLITKLSKYGMVHVCKIGTVFTLFMKGEKLDNFMTFSAIQKIILEYVGDDYPLVEVLQNESDFLLCVYKRED